MITYSMFWALIVAGGAAVLLAAADNAAAAPAVAVPRVDGITIDGEADDWGERGFRVNILGPDTDPLPPERFDGRLRIAWDERGLLVLAVVRDTAPFEVDDPEEFWRRDSVYVSVTGPGVDPTEAFITPGRYPKPAPPRIFVPTDRNSAATAPARPKITVERTISADGYVMEILVPWAKLGVAPKMGMRLNLRVYVNDSGGVGDDRQRLRWPAAGSGQVELAEKPGEPISAVISGGVHQHRGPYVEVLATQELSGRSVSVREGQTELASSTLGAYQGRTGAMLAFPRRVYGQLEVLIDGRSVGSLALADAQVVAAGRIAALDVRPEAYVFAAPALPRFEFAQPDTAFVLLGKCDIRAMYYDANGQVVQQAKTPGRYGAVVEIVPAEGPPLRRFVTLYCLPEGQSPDKLKVDVKVSLPAAAGVDPAVAEATDEVGEYVRQRLLEGCRQDPQSAVLLCALHERVEHDGPVSFYDDATRVNRRWWLALKRRLYGWDQRFNKPLVCPRPIEGPLAPVVREGTLQEAGFTPEGIGRLDAVCREWAEKSGEAMGVCIVRNGVIALHKAYGLRDGAPMTVDTRSWMASITKTVSGTLLTMALDQGLISLDDKAADFLPPWQGIAVNEPMTIRHMYTHTAGFRDVAGATAVDGPERMVSMLPYMQVAHEYFYSNADMETAMQILEGITNETLPDMYRKQLLEPLGNNLTHAGDAASGTFSVPLEMARFGQMLLNRGAYGQWRFFSEESFEKMLPRRLTDILGPDTTAAPYGLGTYSYKDRGLGAGAFGHGAASAALMRIYPQANLVLSMTRNTAGRQYEDYRVKFLEALAGAMIDPPATQASGSH